MEKKIIFPKEVIRIAEILRESGKIGYAVGGCVRDSIMGREPSDWDMTTDASPDEMLEIFERAGLHTIPTGLKHGTVTVMMNKKPYECTTFRIDGDYHDSRRPDSVTFTKNIAEDLCRRDFTVNAMAADPLAEKDGIIDLYGGCEDIENKIIRCVGEPEKRFTEDALRILRAVRFASTLGFEIEEKTEIAAKILGKRLENISAERKSVELEKILLSDGADRGILTLCQLDIAKYIHKDIKMPSLEIKSLPRELPTRLASLFLGVEGLSLASMKLSGELTRQTKLLADEALYGQNSARFGDDMGADARFMLSKYGDLARSAALLRQDREFAAIIERERKKDPCVSIGGLCVNGNDLLQRGIEPKVLGRIFERLLIEVIKRPDKNEKDTLIMLAEKIATESGEEIK